MYSWQLLTETRRPTSLASDQIVSFLWGNGPGLKLWNLDAAMPFDFEHRARARLAKERQLKVGVVGFGTFGQFLAKRLVEAGHKVTSGPLLSSPCLPSRPPPPQAWRSIPAFGLTREGTGCANELCPPCHFRSVSLLSYPSALFRDPHA